MMRLMVRGGAVGVQRAEDQVAGFGGGDGGGDGRQIAHFADQHDVGVLTQGTAEGLGEDRHVDADLALHDDRFFVGVVIFDGVFHRDDVAVEVLVDVVDHASPAWWFCPSRWAR